MHDACSVGVSLISPGFLYLNFPITGRYGIMTYDSDILEAVVFLMVLETLEKYHDNGFGNTRKIS
jgi:hypothetical protein